MPAFLCPVCFAGAGQADCATCQGTGGVVARDWAPRPWDEVAPNLWLGGHDWAGEPPSPGGQESETEHLAAAGFDVIISFYKRWGCEAPEGVEEHYHRIPDGVLDSAELRRVRELGELAARRASEGKKVLIRCQAGFNRSSLCMVFAMRQLGWGTKDAIDHIRATRSPDCLCNGTFVQYLMEEGA